MARSADIMNTDAKSNTRSRPGTDNSQGRTQRDVNGYQSPYGPTTQMRFAPGLGGDVFPCGTQGPYDYDCESSGKVGLTGDKPRQGVNKRRA